tara:strand:- start:18 stop:782 length:765 start_codon:yes stop_codon:yes gene_type:complete
MKINNIYNEDCFVTMGNMPKHFIDTIITSPPYNTMRTNVNDVGYDVYIDNINNKDYIEWTIKIFNEFNRILKKNGVIIYNLSYGGENTSLMNLVVSDIIRNTEFTLADIIVWKKTTATPNNVSPNKLTRIVEFVYIFCRKKEFETFSANKEKKSKSTTDQNIYGNIYNFIEAKNNDGSNDLNKATYSTELVRKLAKIYCLKNSLIYDPFMGTGTTALGCVIDNHNFIGSEISKDQCDYAIKRLQPFLNQTSLFQ